MESFSSGEVALEIGSKRVRGIDGARALAMTAVVAEHSRIFTFGWMGVWLFYVISGFVVTGSLLGRHSYSRLSFIRDFYTRRFARIVPVYYLLLIIATVVSILTLSRVSLPTLSSLVFFYDNIAMAQGWGDLPGFRVGNLWTVSVEMQFYALYGLAFPFMSRRQLLFGAGALIVICPVARLLWGIWLARSAVPSLNAAYFIYSSSFTHFDAFAAGCLLALTRRRMTTQFAYFLAGMAGLTSLTYFMTYYVINLRIGARGLGAARNIISGILFGQHREAFVYIPVVVCSAALIALIERRSRFLRFFEWAPLVFVGEVSYGAYLFHAATLGIAGRLLSNVSYFSQHIYLARILLFLIAWSLAVTLAVVSFYFFEKKITHVTGRWLNQKSSGASVGPA